MEDEEVTYDVGRINGPYGFSLKQNESLICCPFNPVHVVLNSTMECHLFKCRRIYIKRMQDTESAINYCTCKFNSEHSVLDIELEFHEEVCPHRRSRPLLRTRSNLELERDSPPEHEDELGRDIHKHLTGKVSFMSRRKFTAMDSVEKEAFENWDLQAKLFLAEAFDPQKNLEYKLKRYVSPPPGLSRSERRGWRQEWGEKIPRIYDPTDPDFVGGTCDDDLELATKTVEDWW